MLSKENLKSDKICENGNNNQTRNRLNRTNLRPKFLSLLDDISDDTHNTKLF